MLYKHFTEKLLGLQGLNITNIEENEKSIIIYAEMERKEHTCICCGTATNTVHDYRTQVIKDIPAAIDWFSNSDFAFLKSEESIVIGFVIKDPNIENTKMMPTVKNFQL